MNRYRNSRSHVRWYFDRIGRTKDGRRSIKITYKFHVMQSRIKIINLDITARWIEQQQTYAGIFIY